jgi:hypothetical protein
MFCRHRTFTENNHLAYFDQCCQPFHAIFIERIYLKIDNISLLGVWVQLKRLGLGAFIGHEPKKVVPKLYELCQIDIDRFGIM